MDKDLGKIYVLCASVSLLLVATMIILNGIMVFIDLILELTAIANFCIVSGIILYFVSSLLGDD